MKVRECVRDFAFGNPLAGRLDASNASLPCSTNCAGKPSATSPARQKTYSGAVTTQTHNHPETSGWRESAKTWKPRIRAACLVLNLPDTPPFIATTDAEQVGEWVDTIVRDGRELATLLHNRPELSAVPYELWAKTPQLVYKSVFAATRKLRAFRDQVRQPPSQPDERQREHTHRLGKVRIPLEELNKKGAFFRILDAIDQTHQPESDCPVRVVERQAGKYLEFRDGEDWKVFNQKLEPGAAEALDELCKHRRSPTTPPPLLDDSQKRQLRDLRGKLAPVAPWIIPRGRYQIGNPPAA